MKNLIFLFVIMLLTMSNILGQGKYAKLTLDEGPSALKSPKVKTQVDNNCAFLNSKTAWDVDLSTNQKSQCGLFSEYISFSAEYLSWIDSVSLTTEYDPAVKMEVEVVSFYLEGNQVPAASFLDSRIEKCKGVSSGKSIAGCATYFAELATSALTILNSTKDLATSSEKLVTESQEKLQKEIDELKGARSPAAIKTVKQKKDNMESLKLFGENSGVLLPGLVSMIDYDYKTINGVIQTLKKLEKGL